MTIIQTIIILSILLYPSTFIHIDAQEEVNVEIVGGSKKVDNVSKYLENTDVIKNIYIKNKLVNFITKR